MKLNKFGNVLILSDNQEVNVFVSALLDDYCRIYVWETLEDIVLSNIIEYMDCIIIDNDIIEKCEFNINKMIKSISSCPIVILSESHNESINKETFAREVVFTKPINLSLLRKSVEGLIDEYVNRQKKFIMEEMVIGKYTYCPKKLLMFSEGDIILLSPLENMILSYMCFNNQEVITYKHMYETIWGKPYDDDQTVVSLKVDQLRFKLRDNIIVNEKDLGYRLINKPLACQA